MKKYIIRMLIVVVSMAMFGVNSYAQKTGKQRLTREQLADKQARYIAGEMAFDDQTTEQFVKTYCNFQQDLWAIGPRPKRAKADRTEAEAKEAMNDRFEHSQQVLDLRKKYYAEYSKFLTQKQIERVYKLENSMMKRLSQRAQKRRAQK